MIRKGEKESFVEISLYMPQSSLAIDGNIIISREICQNGRNLCKINGRLVTVNELKKFMKTVIDIHGQHDNQNIMEPQTHIEYLDNFIGEEIKNIKNEYKEYFLRYNNLKMELKKNYGDDKERERKNSLLKYQLDEIEEAKLRENEEDELETRRKVMINSEKIAENLKIANENIGNIALDAVSKSIKALEKIENLNDEFKNRLDSLRSIYYDMQEVSRDLCDLDENLEFDQDLAENIERRLSSIYSLKRKYGNNIKEILEYKESLIEQINTIENLEEHNNELKKEICTIEREMLKLSEKMHELRTKYSLKLEQGINFELKDLEMKNARLKVNVEYSIEKEFNSNGLNKVELLISTNIGEDLKQLTKIASGGEISRIMLAIKTVLSNSDNVPVMIFDEIDTGISGIAATKVGEKLKQISKFHQVLCVTHLANIAAKGDYNYYINKTVEGEKTKTNVKILNEDEVLEEIARISTGEITEIAINHARELRKSKIA